MCASKIAMKNIIVIALCLTVLAPKTQAAETSEVVITRGTRAGQTIRFLKTEQVEHKAWPTNSHNPQILGLFVNGQATNIPVDVAAFYHTLVQRLPSGLELTNECYELTVHSRGSTNFEWSTLARSHGGGPDDIIILNAALGRSYACYSYDIWSLHLFRLGGNRPSKQMREVFFSNEPHPDALPPLSTRSTHIVTTNQNGTINNSMHVFAVDSLRETTNGLQLTLRVDNAESKVTYTLWDGKWMENKP